MTRANNLVLNQNENNGILLELLTYFTFPHCGTLL